MEFHERVQPCRTKFPSEYKASAENGSLLVPAVADRRDRPGSQDMVRLLRPRRTAQARSSQFDSLAFSRSMQSIVRSTNTMLFGNAHPRCGEEASSNLPPWFIHLYLCRCGTDSAAGLPRICGRCAGPLWPRCAAWLRATQRLGAKSSTAKRLRRLRALAHPRPGLRGQARPPL